MDLGKSISFLVCLFNELAGHWSIWLFVSCFCAFSPTHFISNVLKYFWIRNRKKKEIKEYPLVQLWKDWWIMISLFLICKNAPWQNKVRREVFTLKPVFWVSNASLYYFVLLITGCQFLYEETFCERLSQYKILWWIEITDMCGQEWLSIREVRDKLSFGNNIEIFHESKTTCFKMIYNTFMF